MIDTFDREVSTPWSKILKLGRAVELLITKCKASITIDEIHTIIGLCWYVFATAPHLIPVLTPRLGAIVSKVVVDVLKCGKEPKGRRVFSPSMGKETNAEGWEELRKVLDIFWRLASWRKGALLKHLLEAGLPLKDRLCWPSKEKPLVLKLFHMDASGKAAFFLTTPQADTAE